MHKSFGSLSVEKCCVFPHYDAVTE